MEAHEVQQKLNGLTVKELKEKLGQDAVYLSIEGACPTEYCLCIRDSQGKSIGFF